MFLLGFVIVLFSGLVLMFAVLANNQEALKKAMREDHEQFDARLRQLEALVNFCAKTARQGMNTTEPEPRETTTRYSTLSAPPSYLSDAPLGSPRPTYSEPAPSYTSEASIRQAELQLGFSSERPSTRSSSHQKEGGMPELKM